MTATYQLTHLQQLENESIQIIREVAAEFQNPVMLYSIGKDSAAMLHVALKAFYPAKLPFPLLHVDTTWKFRAMYEMRERMAREQMDLYKRTGSNPLSSCLPLLLQMPIFTGLFFVLNDAGNNKSGVGLLTQEMAISFSQAEIFGAKLSDTFFGSDEWNVKVLAGIMIVLMSEPPK